MKKFFFSPLCIFNVVIVVILLLSFQAGAQQLNISDFVLFGGNGNCPSGSGQATPPSPGCALQIGSSTSIQGGSIGSFNLVKSTGTASVTGNIYSGGTVVLANSNTVNGKITAANTLNSTATILFVGSGALLGGNIDVKGKITVGGGTVSGRVTHPTGTTYTGPTPGGGNVTGTPTLPTLPQMPAITSFQAYGSTNVTSTQTLSPGTYCSMTLSGNKTVTFSGPGIYVFKSIKNTGSNNSFVFNFNNSATGTIKIYVHGDIDLGKVTATLLNGGSASRIYTETHGTGSSCSSGAYSFVIANGSSASNCSKWLGTVWAPYAGINIGSGTGNSNLTGALLSGTQVNVQCGITIIFAPFVSCSTPNVNAGPDKELNCIVSSVQLSGSSTNQNVQYSWTPVGNGHIVSGAATLTPIVDAAAKYVLTVTDPNGGCYATDTVQVNFVQCIFPYYPPPPNGKTENNLIGSELSSLYQFFGFVTDTAQNIFILSHDSVMIEVISRTGQYGPLLTLLQTTPYGITDLVDNGPNSLIITGRYPINHLKKLDSLPTLIDYVRPVFPPLGNVGVANSAGDTAVRADFVRNGYGLSGDSVKVGVLSDSYNTIPGDPAGTDVLNGDLPGPGNTDNANPVHVIKDYPFGKRTDEGRAMLQIVHDIAPKAKLAFRTGFVSAGDFAQGILQLQQDSCNVIVDDVTFITEPFFQDGVVAKAVDSVTSKGVSYFSAAGNFGNQSYESIFRPVAAPNGIVGQAHNFSTTGTDVFQNITLTPGTYTVVLQWEDDIYSLGPSQNGTTNDLDIYLTDNNGQPLFGFNRNNLGGDPLEILPFTVTQNTTTNIIIVRAAGTGNVRFKYIFFRGNTVISEYNSGNSTIVGQANAAGAMAVGAVLYTNTPAYGVNPPTVASFSSRGGTPVNNVVRNKPEFTAPNGINTTVNFGGVNIDGDPLPNFFGTSAAAPHAAAVAALLIEGKRKFANQTITPAALRTLMETTALDMDATGFDFNTGYGFIQANTAMRTFATPTPVINDLQLLVPPTTPGPAPVVLTVQGNYLDGQSVINFRGNPLPTTVVSPTTLSATIPAFTGNPAIQVYTPPVSVNGTDGGLSNSLYFFTPIKKHVVITAENKVKRYGEKIPAFTVTVTVDNVPLANSGFTLQQLGLDPISFTTTATSFSNTGIYAIKPAMRVLDMNDPFDAGLPELYDYTFVNGLLTINKLPVTITSRDTTLEYGDKITDLHFNYNYDDTNIDDADKAAFFANLKTAHTQKVSNAVALVDDQTVIDGRTLQTSDLTDLSFLVSVRAAVNTRAAVNVRAAVNSVVFDTTYVVDLSPKSIYNYQQDSATTTLVNVRAAVNTRAAVNVRAAVNGGAVVNSRALALNSPFVNASTVNDETNQDLVVIIDSTDVYAPANDTLVDFIPINLITGMTSGLHKIVPAAFISENFDVSYQLGNLNITPAHLTATTGSANMIYGAALPAFSSTITGYKFQDDASTVFTGPITYSLVNASNVTIPNTNIPAGTFSIVPVASFIQPTNYTIDYSNGTLNVGKAALTARAVDTSRIYGNANPVFRIVYTGFVNGDGPANITAPTAVTTATVSSPVGAYPITLSGGSSNNYTVTNTNGTLTISKALLAAKAVDTSRIYGNANPVFRIAYTGFVNGDGPANITQPVAATTASVTSGVGTYPITLTGGSSGNYSITNTNGTLTIGKRNLIVTADDKVIFKGSSLPTYTSTITGYVNNDQTRCTSGPAYTVSPACTGAAGVYTITPSNLVLSSPTRNYYTITYMPGKLYINPKGTGAKNITLALRCKDALTNSPTGYSYVAHFEATNGNATAVYVAVGADNNLTPAGTWSGTIPVVFQPGKTTFDVFFNGTSIKWTVATYCVNTKTTVSVTATPSSPSCATNIYTRGNVASPQEIVKKDVKKLTHSSADDLLSGNTNVYPNPVTNKVRITVKDAVLSTQGLTIIDMTGRTWLVANATKLSGNSIELDLSKLSSGVYFIKVKVDNTYKEFRILKQ